jgi:hypothetical protein
MKLMTWQGWKTEWNKQDIRLDGRAICNLNKMERLEGRSGWKQEDGKAEWKGWMED